MKIYINQIIRQSEKAALVEVPITGGRLERTEQVWLPLSQIKFIDKAGQLFADMPDWLVRAKNEAVQGWMAHINEDVFNTL